MYLSDNLLSTSLTYMAMKSKFHQSSAVTKTMIELARLLAGCQEELSAFDISMWFEDYDGPPEGAEIMLSQDLARYYISSADDGDLLYPALASILRVSAKDFGPWESIIRTLVRSGTNVHAPVRRRLSYLDQSQYPCPLAQYGTPLDELFMETLDPWQGQAAANSWLQILASEGHDILVYLREESDLHIRPMQLTHPSYHHPGYDNERKLVFDLGPRPSVTWDWWINPRSPAFLLRQEFKLMAISAPDWFLIARPWKDSWPIRHPIWSELHQSYGNADSCKRREKLLKLAGMRTAKRLAKKAQKSGRPQIYEEPRKVPGAWPV